ncbi:MAG: sensor histidine kinase [Gorillibacterium sp.]|nr:sensor histidine kinase [Gorillibacterium sp.]
MLQLVKQNHVTMENTLSSVRDKSITFLDNNFFSSSKQFDFWTHIDSIGELSEADAILERWSSDGTEYALYLKETAASLFPISVNFKSKGLIYLQSEAPFYPEWAEETLRELGAGSLRLAKSDKGLPTISFTRSILHPEKYNESIGFLVVSKLEVLLMKNLISVQLPEDAAIFLFDNQDDLLMKSGEEDMGLTELPEDLRNRESGYYYADSGKQPFLYAVSHESSFHTRLVYKVPLHSITGNQNSFQRMITLMLAIYLFLVLLFVLYLLRNIIKPLARLVTFTRIYEPGKPFNFSSHSPRNRSDEFGLLYDAFMRMTTRLDQSIEENYGMQIKQKEQELSTLHSQITPHLLYNTLDSIYWYSLESGNQEIGSMVKDLSKLLRIGLSRGNRIITIGEELEHVQAYIRLQMMRYPEVFEVFWEVGAGAEACEVPKVIIQPLVENAIFHGIQSMDGEGALWIRINRDEEDLHITVEDNGFIPVDLDKMRMIISGELQDKGYGIRNVHQRIQLHYGAAYGLSYTLREGGGLIATITLPANKKE